jgi:hypothetical protein
MSEYCGAKVRVNGERAMVNGNGQWGLGIWDWEWECHAGGYGGFNDT